MVICENSGQHLITNFNGKVPQPGEMADVLYSGKIGTPSAYTIKDGRIVTTLEHAFRGNPLQSGRQIRGRTQQ